MCDIFAAQGFPGELDGMMNASSEPRIELPSLPLLTGELLNFDPALGATNKDEVYFKLLEQYKYDTVTYYDEKKERQTVEYKCGYPGCGKILQKPWNLLDHVRMHEGVKPFTCQWCGKGFTQKGNLKKHCRQHVHPNVNDRKRYSCRFCGKGYTERYNLKVNLALLLVYHLINIKFSIVLESYKF